MWKIVRIAVLFAAANMVLMGAAEEPDIFANATVVPFALRSGDINPQLRSVYVGDELRNPQTVFYAGDSVCWWADGIVTPQGTGPSDQALDVTAITSRRTRSFHADFVICNDDPNSAGDCDDIPTSTTWTLGICVGPIPLFVDRLLQRFGSVPFDSVVAGTGYEDFSVNLTGNSVDPLPAP